ncbi:twin-arginine translocation pathway signal [Streptosporangium jomthongense]|uniref:NAD(P)/FAD-dependent oxidoreductase n=1 Tax=Marinobacter aromaticivorans TaxID=1494078 RepID=A0ABW2IQ69_9GAMM|nr:FAD/NAD(P)-binding oxidoreductase [Marinobacter aromaticivorans]GGE53508.1 twin-arginine translocation pathway signal [Streptosporangium jomthongense]
MPRFPLKSPNLGRRELLKLGLGASAAGLMPLSSLMANTVSTRARIVILGGGAAGMSMANRLVRRLSGATITVVEPRELHQYQPGWTLVASGVWEADRTLRPNADFRPAGIDWVKGPAVGIDAEQRKITLADASTLEYDLLVVATGLQLNYDLIEGMSPELIGSNGIGSVYASLEAATRTRDAIDGWLDKGGGQGIFTSPQTAIKCAGAPIKMTFTTLSRIKAKGERERFDLDYYTAGGGMFSQPWVSEFLKQRFDRENITRHHLQYLSAIDPAGRQAEFTSKDGSTEVRDYDFIHVVPPMSAPDFVKDSDLIAQDGPFKGEWLDSDMYTMQHNRYPEVFGIGDVIGCPINKTAASVKAQAPVVEANIAAFLQEKALPARHNGYTSCPLITDIGKAMLVEFGYDNNMDFLPSFSFIDPKEESWSVWVLKDHLLQPAYYAMLKGRV